ncbi:hypothetical protein [Sulfuriflexus mobilis]|uniref:hypothetical protein n=1 Tax=Sulfuriflexus mobilis TaxID=1811807 RepID=UPI000F829F08|nr:hypothetical protein [Sulfuriflexus mobilis]
MKTKLAVVLILLLLGFLATRIRLPDNEVSPAIPSLPSSTSLPSVPAAPTTSDTASPETVLFNLNGEWRGVLEPVHGNHLDPRDWDLELKFFIFGDKAQVFIRRGEQWQEVKPGKFKLAHHKSNAILYSMDSGTGWVESWVFSLSRHDQERINVYGNRLINNFRQLTSQQGSRITYGATGNFARVYERHRTEQKKKSEPLSEDDIAAQIQLAIERGKRLAGKAGPGGLRVLEHRISHETNDSANLLVKYDYDGTVDDNAWISAITFNEGKSTGHWSFRPVKLVHGKRVAQIHIGMGSQSPAEYCSDSFVIQAYIPGGGNFFEQTMPYKRCWSKE